MGASSGYAALGFDPAPGIVGSVEQLTAQVRDAVVRLGSTEQDLDTMLRDLNRWKGEAGAEFHTAMLGMVANAGVTKDCLFAVQLALAGWGALLSDYQRTRQSLEEQAAAARARLAQAEDAPGMTQKPHGFEDRDEYERKSAAYSAARAETDAADEALDTILRAARDLKDMHRESAKSAAREIRNAVQRMTGEQWKQQHAYPDPPAYYPVGPGGMGLPGQLNSEYQTLLASYFTGKAMPTSRGSVPSLSGRATASSCAGSSYPARRPRSESCMATTAASPRTRTRRTGW